ncbi:MAG: hypothetical protein KDK41_07790 [Leptospiraceae bacterium]|nr:hypothetical protein [Leptospiraceae bacterium]
MKKSIQLVAIAAAITFTAAASAEGLGLRVGLGLGFATNILNQSGNLKKLGAANAGYTKAQADSIGTGAGQSSAFSSSENGGNSFSGIDASLRVEYDILPWLYARTGFNYAQVFSQEYAFTATNLNNGVNSTTNTATFSMKGDMIEIPLMIGLNLIQTETSAIYFAVGPTFVSGGVDYTLSATGTRKAADGGAAATFKDVNAKLSTSTFGVAYALGGRVQIADNITVFGEVRYLAAAKVGVEIEKTRQDGSSVYANQNVLADGLLTGIGTDGIAKFDTYTAAQKKQDVDGMDFSYTRWNVGVNYSL